MQESLYKVIKHAYINSEFYRKMLKESGFGLEEILTDGEKIPVISKDDIVQSKDSIVPYMYYSKIARGEILSASTSGSTGKCFEVYYKKSEMKKSLLSLWLYRKKYYGIAPKDKYCYFYTIRNTETEVMQEVRANGMGFSKVDLSQKRLEEIYISMQKYQPVWLLLQPGIAIRLAQFIFEYGAEPIESLRYIELTGEMFSEQNRNFIKNAFDVPVASQYGCNEAGTIAYECPQGHLHIMEHNVHVDIRNDGKPAKTGESGSIIITAKNNYVMPLIKYDTGDRGLFEEKECSCGNRGKILKLLAGRKNDKILLENGKGIGVDEFVRAFLCVGQKIDGKILQYRIKQVDYGKFEVSIVTDSNREDIKEIFLDSLIHDDLRAAEYTFRFCEYLLPDPKSGKLKFFENHLLSNS